MQSPPSVGPSIRLSICFHSTLCPEKKRGSTFDIITLEKHA